MWKNQPNRIQAYFDPGGLLYFPRHIIIHAHVGI